MMATVQTLTRRFERVFEPQQAVVLAESITEAYEDLVKTSDFNELKAIVKNLAEAQQRLAESQQRLAESQESTEAQMKELARVVTNMGQELGGLSRSMGYSLSALCLRRLSGGCHARALSNGRRVRGRSGLQFAYHCLRAEPPHSWPVAPATMRWLHAKRAWHTAQALGVPHFVQVPIADRRLELQAIDVEGRLFDRLVLTKPALPARTRDNKRRG